MSISSQPFRILSDHMDVYDFLTEIAETGCRNGVAAPFLEYALSSDWMDKTFAHRWRIWQDGEKSLARGLPLHRTEPPRHSEGNGMLLEGLRP